MTRGMIYKLFFIVALIAFAVLLILPTFGRKEMVISLYQKDSSTQQAVVEKLQSRFNSGENKGNYDFAVKDNIVTVSGINLTSAIMNEVLQFDGVESAEIETHWAETYLLAKKINLGLDLQGGMHLVMTANFDELQKTKFKQLTAVEREKLSNTEKEKGVVALSDSEKSQITQQALERIRNRIDGTGVAEPLIRMKGNEAIEIQLPGVRNPEQVKDMLKKTGRVQYRLVHDQYTEQAMNWMINTWLPANSQGETLPAERLGKINLLAKYLPKKVADREKVLAEATKAINLSEEYSILYHFIRNETEGGSELVADQVLVLENKVSVDGEDIKNAWPNKDDFGKYKVNFELHSAGAAKFAKVTAKENQKKRLAIVIDNKIRSKPAINSQITGGRAEITGSFTLKEVETLAGIIKEGALPVTLKIIEERTVGATLGQDAIKSGMKAIVIGVLGIMLFMLIYYKLGGFISGIGLIINMIFMLALLSWLGATLTLPGIAGFILTVGMAVDANVIIYERIKEELREGKSVRMSIRYGFEKAFWTIFDANLTTIIAAIILYSKGTGPIKGFAVILLIGVISSMFVALYITRYIYELISLNKKLKKLSI